MKIHLTFLLVMNALFSMGQSIVLSPDTPNKGIYAERESAYIFNAVDPPLQLAEEAAGTRFMWIPERSALRAGTVLDNSWDADSIGAYSFAFGLNTVALGLASGAIGLENKVRGRQAFAGGVSNTITGNQSMAFGLGNRVFAAQSVSFGNANKIESGANYSFLAGNDNIVASEKSFLIGLENKGQADYQYLFGEGNSGKNQHAFGFGVSNAVSGHTSLSVGFFNNNAAANTFNFGEGNKANFERAMNVGFDNASKAFKALAIGTGNVPLGELSLALGTANRPSGIQSTDIGTGNSTHSDKGASIGLGLVNNSFGAVVTGLYNDSLSTNLSGVALSKEAYKSADPVFLVGNGKGENERSNALSVFKNGKVGLGTNSPTELLDVNGNARFRNIPITQAKYVLGVTLNGTLTLVSEVSQPGYLPSDSRLKTNVEDISDPLEKVAKMKGHYFEYKSNSGQRHVGLIAQEVEQIVPEVVKTDEITGFKSVNYQELVGLLIEAVKSQQNTIVEISARLLNLEEVVSGFSQTK
ncbi:tail fiber domain-containing protein [Marinilongibacter aquaticus]|uniref:tail fiber domain-containing protein n=1 Tax=Marinilongibacter aquaticus TaxID=2975157 RepID=UPI0021BD04BF|nr:tail fiber domain-containing protein [Marinilongibacter aquaticus]UBM58363.1 tail fiber domain-containing protein [Marinilongibacter aquaticus]